MKPPPLRYTHAELSAWALAVDALVLDEVPASEVHELVPAPVAAPVEVHDAHVLSADVAPEACAAGVRARRRERFRGRLRHKWTVPAVGELEERQAVGAPRAQRASEPEPYRDFHGRARTCPPLETVASPGLRRALLLEQRRWDLEPQPGEDGYRPPVDSPRLSPSEAVAPPPARLGATLRALWAWADAAVSVSHDSQRAQDEESAFRSWARRQGYRVRKPRGEGGTWQALPVAAHNVLHEACSLEALRGALEAVHGPRARRGAKASKSPLPESSPLPGQLSLFEVAS